MKKVLAGSAVIAVAAFAAVPALAGTKSVKVGDDYFIKRGGGTVTINSGSSVKWLWKGSDPHNVVKKSGPGGKFQSKVKTKGSYTHKFTKGGSYKIICTIHPGMKMTVKVK